MSLLLLALVQVSPTTAPPPVVPRTEPAESYARWLKARETERAGISTKSVVFEVDASAGGRTIWQGALRASQRNSANFQQTLNEAPPRGCIADEATYNTARNSFAVSISLSNIGEAAPQQRFTISWERSAGDCSDPLIQRTVSMTGMLALRPGGSETVQGDGGLKVRFTRR